MLMSRLRTDRQTDGNVKVEQYSAEAESAIIDIDIDWRFIEKLSISKKMTYRPPLHIVDGCHNPTVHCSGDQHHLVGTWGSI